MFLALCRFVKMKLLLYCGSNAIYMIGVTVVLPQCYLSVTSVLPQCYPSVTSVLPQCYLSVTSVGRESASEIHGTLFDLLV